MRFFILLQKAYLPLIHTHTQLFSIIFCPEIQQDFYNTLINRYFSGLVALRWKPKARDNRKKGRKEKKSETQSDGKGQNSFLPFFPLFTFFFLFAVLSCFPFFSHFGFSPLDAGVSLSRWWGISRYF